MDTNSLDEKLGKRLADHRKQLGLSQEYLAELMNHDQTYVSKVETGKRQLTVTSFLNWCSVLNLTQEDMLQILRIKN